MSEALRRIGIGIAEEPEKVVASANTRQRTV